MFSEYPRSLALLSGARFRYPHKRIPAHKRQKFDVLNSRMFIVQNVTYDLQKDAKIPQAGSYHCIPASAGVPGMCHRAQEINIMVSLIMEHRINDEFTGDAP